MAIKLGTNDISALKLGALDVDKAYLGADEIYPPVANTPIHKGTDGSVYTGSSVSTSTVPRPNPYAEGDVIVIFAGASGVDTSAGSIPGFTKLLSASTTNNNSAVFAKIATASEPSSYTISHYTTNAMVHTSLVFGNADISQFLLAQGETGQAPSLTSTKQGSIFTHYHSQRSNNSICSIQPGGSERLYCNFVSSSQNQNSNKNIATYDSGSPTGAVTYYTGGSITLSVSLLVQGFV